MRAACLQRGCKHDWVQACSAVHWFGGFVQAQAAGLQTGHPTDTRFGAGVRFKMACDFQRAHARLPAPVLVPSLHAEIRAATGKMRKSGKKAPAPLTAHQKQIVQRLLDAHGEDIQVRSSR